MFDFLHRGLIVFQKAGDSSARETMVIKSNIDRFRDGAARMEVGKLDEGPIAGFVKIGDRLLIVKEKAVYEVLMADTIDPGRTNISIPNAQQKVLDIGSTSQLLSRTLLTADRLLNQQYFGERINCEGARKSALEVARHLAAIADNVRLLEEATVRALNDIGRRHLSESFAIPSILGLEPMCKAAFQHAHHAIKSTMDMVREFYGKEITHPSSMYSHLRSKEQGDLLEWLGTNLNPLVRIWQWRNAVEHPKNNEKMVVADFKLLPSGQIAPPSIEMMHPSQQLCSMPASDVLRDVVDSVSASFENLLAFCCSRHASFGEFEMAIGELPTDRRNYPHERYAYFARLGDQYVPIG